MRISRKCDNPMCQKEYIADTREMNRGNGIYCSRQCSGEMLSLKRQQEKKEKGFDVFCAICNEGIYLRASRLKRNKSGIFFCSKEHQAQGMRDKSIPVTSGPAKKVPKRICLRCPQILRGKGNTLCKVCIKQDKVDRWLSGEMSATWTTTSKEPLGFVKEYLLKTRGDKCESCGFDKKRPNGTSKMQMDHIDGDYTNNALDNLRLLCPNCHDDTETYGSKNKNGGRRYRQYTFKPSDS